MVYYPSTQLIIKSEDHSPAPLCGTLRTTHMEQQQSAHMQHPTQHATLNAYTTLGNVSVAMQQHQMPIGNSNTSISSHHQQQQQQQQQHQQQYLANIKTELLPPSITVYATAKPQLPAAELAAQNVSSSSSSNNGTPTSTTSAVAAGRKANKPQFKCDQCGMTFGSKSAHTSHTKSHAKNGELSMLAAGNFAAAAGAAIEISEAGLPMGIPKTPQLKPNANAANNGGDPYQCNVCLKTFAVQARLIRHYRTHTGERPFECEFCHKLFSVKENLQVHRRIHTKERPYKCEVCGRAFEHSGKLHRHMRIHTGERPHKCNVCEKTFIQSGQLVIHMRTHTGEKPYKCPVEGCGKGFTCSKQLKVHSRTHTGEKPYHCDICFRDFGYNHVLKLHRVQHYGAKCYKCTICDETFKSKKEMEAHIKGHANDDDEEAAVAAANGNTPTSSSTASDTNSSPDSPQSPSSSVGTISSSAASSKQQTVKQKKLRSVSSSAPLSPGSPASPTSSMSPSSSYASGSRLSAASPTSSIASPTMSLSMETDHHSRDSGVASGSIPTSNSARQMASVATSMKMMHVGGFPTAEEMPTDLSIAQHSHHQQPTSTHAAGGYIYHNSPPSPAERQYHYPAGSSQQHNAIELHSAAIATHSPPQYEQHTINPALLEAATIASRREDDIQAAAMKIMQLHHSQQKPLLPPAIANESAAPIYSDMHHHAVSADRMGSLNRHAAALAEEQYGDECELSKPKGYEPVPKFETSLPNNEIILRQVEAAIAPMRSSVESPERSFSPESDMLMADRDVMTLPLRKRKLYMSDMAEASDMDNATASNAKDVNSKIMRHSSVIQFAKAS